MRISDWSSDVCSSDLEQADRPDVPPQALLAQGQHRLGRPDLPEQLLGRLVHPYVGRLRRQDDGDQEGIGIMMVEFALRFRIGGGQAAEERSEEHTSELQSLMRISYAVFCLKKKKNTRTESTRII